MAHDLIHPPDAEAQAFTLTRPAQHLVPLVFVSAHSGRDYSADFLAATRLDATALRKSEDAFVEELFAAAPGLGAPLLAARFPRAWCDANREAWELDPGMFDEPLPDWVNSASPRVGAGLGTIARVVANGEAIYRHRLSFREAELSVRFSWEPFHIALAALVAETHARFGACLLVDCHSMPTPPGHTGGHTGGHMGGQSSEGPQFVLGDAHGSACAPRTTRAMEALLQGQGFRVQRNDPYAGGYITRHYGRPRENTHAIQIEIARGLYMDEGRVERARHFDVFRAQMDQVVDSLVGLDWAALLKPGR